MERAYGVLTPVFSLPSPYGIGTLGKAAFDFIDFLSAAGARWWQVLPVGPTGSGDSPYQTFSTFAGNPWFIDPDLLAADDLLTAAELRDAETAFPDGALVDYGALCRDRLDLLRPAAERLWQRNGAALEAFAAVQTWLPDYARFMALRRRFCGTAWPEAVRLHDAAALRALDAELAPDVRLHIALQWLFFRQWDALRAYAAARNVQILGDLPIYAAPDSADVWSEPQFFQLDGQRRPAAVAGVPPDYFSAEGQLWGNPLYDWAAMARDGFGWWLRRVQTAARCFDALRIDHFRGLARYWAVPAGAETAQSGCWRTGPGMALIDTLRIHFPQMRFIAEDLGLLTDDVRRLRARSGWPGMTVLQFAFDPSGGSAYLPHNHTQNSVCYTGTHDNTTLCAWAAEAGTAERAFAIRYLGVERPEALPEAVLRAGMGSISALFIAPVQDWLQLGAEGRVNIPGVPTGNWRWRLLPGQLTEHLAAQMADTAALYGRLCVGKPS